MRVTVTDECHHTHQPVEHLLVTHLRNRIVKTRDFLREGFAAYCVESIDVETRELLREMLKVGAPRVGRKVRRRVWRRARGKNYEKRYGDASSFSHASVFNTTSADYKCGNYSLTSVRFPTTVQ